MRIVQTNHTTSFINLIVSFPDQNIEIWKRRKMCTKFIKTGINNNKIPKFFFYRSWSILIIQKVERWPKLLPTLALLPQAPGKWNDPLQHHQYHTFPSLYSIDSAIGWHSFKNSVSFKQDQPERREERQVKNARENICLILRLISSKKRKKK